MIACAVLVSVAAQLCPEGALRAVARFTGGLLLLLAMLRPVAWYEPDAAAWSAGGYREAVARLEQELTAERENALQRGIAEEWEAYIEDKAGSLGAAVRVEAEVGAGEGVPERVTLHGAYHEGLSRFLAFELGVAKEKQIWIEDE